MIDSKQLSKTGVDDKGNIYQSRDDFWNKMRTARETASEEKDSESIDGLASNPLDHEIATYWAKADSDYKTMFGAGDKLQQVDQMDSCRLLDFIRENLPNFQFKRAVGSLRSIEIAARAPAE